MFNPFARKSPDGPVQRVAVIHPGPGKTGSSAIQSYLARHRSELLINHGINYPDLANYLDTVKPDSITSGNCVLLAQSMIPGSELDGESERRTLERALDQPNWTICILSSESFQSSGPEGVNWLAQTLSDRNIRPRIIYYYRNIFDSILSTWNQGLKRHGTTTPLDKFITHSLPIHGPFLDRWMQAFAEEHLEVRNYDACANDVVADFLSALGIPLPKEQDQPRVNPALNSRFTHAMRLLNFGVSGLNSISWLSDRMLTSKQQSTFCEGTPVHLNSHQATLVHELHGADFERVAKYYRGESPLLFAPKEGSLRQGLERATLNEALAIIGILGEEIGHLRQRLTHLETVDRSKDLC